VGGKPPEIEVFQKYQDLLRSLSNQPDPTFDWNAYLADPDSALVGVPLQALDRSTVSVEAFTFDPDAKTVSKEVTNATELNQMLETPHIELNGLPVDQAVLERNVSSAQ
jgi:hypothetical protein